MNVDGAPNLEDDEPRSPKILRQHSSTTPIGRASRRAIRPTRKSYWPNTRRSPIA